MLLRSRICPVPHVQHKCPAGAFRGWEGACTEDLGGCRRRCGWRQQQCEGAARSRHGSFALPTLGSAQAAGGGRGEGVDAEFSATSFPEHPWLSRCYCGDAGPERGWNLCRCGMLIFLLEIRCRCSHITWCVLIQHGGQYALFGVNPHLPARSLRKTIDWRSDSREGRACCNQNVINETSEKSKHRPMGLPPQPPTLR